MGVVGALRRSRPCTSDTKFYSNVLKLRKEETNLGSNDVKARSPSRQPTKLLKSPSKPVTFKPRKPHSKKKPLPAEEEAWKWWGGSGGLLRASYLTHALSVV